MQAEGEATGSDETDVTSRPARWCISYDQLMQVEEQAKDYFGEEYEDKTMRDICKHIIVPRCKKTGKSWALSQNPNGLEMGAFVSHSWDGCFSDFVYAIGITFDACVRKPNLWICSFSLFQSCKEKGGVATANIGGFQEPLVESPFAKALQRAPWFVCVRNSNTDIFTRIWCVCEVYFAKQFGLFPHKTYVTGTNDFAQDPTSCLDAKSTRKEDKIRILGELLKQPSDALVVDNIIGEFRAHGTPHAMIDRQIRRRSSQVIQSQKDVEKRFSSMVRKEGKIYRKGVSSFIRKATKGEHITAEIFGVLETQQTVQTDDEWLVWATAGGVSYPISDTAFHCNYDAQNPKQIPAKPSLPHLAGLRQQGFMEYQSKRCVWARQVTQEDMNFFLARHRDCANRDHAHFMAPWGEPQRVECGDYLATKYPEQDGIYRIEKGYFELSYVDEAAQDRKKRSWLEGLVVPDAATVASFAAGAAFAFLFTLATTTRQRGGLHGKS